MIRSTRPIQSVLLMVFFLSIGLLIDLRFIWDYIGTVVVLLLIVTVLKTALNIGILHLLREPWPHAFIAGVMLAQIGEFSFILSGIGLDRGLLGPNDSRLDRRGHRVLAVVLAALAGRGAASLAHHPLERDVVRGHLRPADRRPARDGEASRRGRRGDGCATAPGARDPPRARRRA